MNKKILICGGGLAGTFLAAELCQAGYSVTMVDAAHPRAASRIAAGLFNVVTGRHAARTWQAELFLETLAAFLARPEFAGLNRFVQYQKIYRPFRNAFDANEWAARSADERFRDLVEIQNHSRLPGVLYDEWGGIDILPCGWADTASLIEGIREVLQQSFDFRYFKGELDYGDIDPQTGTLRAGGHGADIADTYDRIIFAEGIRSLANPWFGFVALQPLKGQVLEVHIPGLEMDFILSRKVFVIPKGNHRFTVGSTYEKHFEHEEPDEKGRAEISGYLAEALKIPFEVMEASASVRPTTPNRKPVLGVHPDFPRLMIQNGLGTKGVLQAPWCAKVTREYLSGERNDFPKETVVTRFLK